MNVKSLIEVVGFGCVRRGNNYLTTALPDADSSTFKGEG